MTITIVPIRDYLETESTDAYIEALIESEQTSPLYQCENCHNLEPAITTQKICYNCDARLNNYGF